MDMVVVMPMVVVMVIAVVVVVVVVMAAFMAVGALMKQEGEEAEKAKLGVNVNSHCLFTLRPLQTHEKQNRYKINIVFMQHEKYHLFY